MELLKLRWAADLLNEFWRSRRRRAAFSPPAVPTGPMPGRAGGLSGTQGLEIPRDSSLPSARLPCSAAGLDSNSVCESIATWCLDALLPTLKCCFLMLGSWRRLLRLFSLFTSISLLDSGRLCRSGGLPVSSCMRLSSNRTLLFSPSPSTYTELLPSICCLCETSRDSSALCASVLFSDWRWPLGFKSGASLCSAGISCCPCWFVGAVAVPTWLDGFRRSAAVGLHVPLPCLLLHACLGLAGTNTG